MWQQRSNFIKLVINMSEFLTNREPCRGRSHICLAMAAKHIADDQFLASSGKAVAHRLGRTVFYSSACSQVQPLTWQAWSISFLQMPSLASTCKQGITNLNHPKSS